MPSHNRWSDLLDIAQSLLETSQTGRGRPRQEYLRRAVSSVYYALFHCLAEQCADNFIGTMRGAEQTKSAWKQVYRSLNHNIAKEACKELLKQNYRQKFPMAAQTYAQFFIDMQRKRHDADYDPFELFTKDDVSGMIAAIKQVIEAFENLPAKHRRAFSAFVLLGKPRR